MRRTTIYLEPELEVLLKLEMRRQKRPMAWVVRAAIHSYLQRDAAEAPPGAGAFASGVSDTAERAEEVLAETGFALAEPRDAGAGRLPAPARRRRPATASRHRPRGRAK